jgi:hypothetical protein
MALLINSSEELRKLTGNYYANNDFSKIEGDIELATEELAELVGSEVIELASKGDDTELLKKVQRPIAIMATLRLYRKNDLSHEDDGRKFKVSTDGTDKLPWEWQLDRDDAMHLEEYYRAVDSLIRYLNKKAPDGWKNSPIYIQSQQLIVRNGRELNRYFPTEGSERLYLMIVPFIREVQTRIVSRAYGDDWNDLLNEKDEETPVHYAAAMSVALLAMSIAMRRLPLRLFPVGVLQGYMAQNGMRSSQTPSLDDVARVASWLQGDGEKWMDEMKRARDGSKPDYSLLPENDPHNKFMRL